MELATPVKIESAFFLNHSLKSKSVYFLIKDGHHQWVFFNQTQTSLRFYQLKMDIISFLIKYGHHFFFAIKYRHV